MNDAQLSKVCFGMTLFNRAQYLPEALESLLNQSYSDFHLVAVDDASTDATEEIMRHYASKDNRITYLRNATWEGMIATWRTAFFKAYERYQPRYFAWASDHDRWHPQWLERHITALDEQPGCVLAYPDTIPIGATGEVLEFDMPESLDTHGLEFGAHLWRVCTQLRGAGYVVYGLFRTLELLKSGVFRRVVMPDRLLVTEIAAYGKILHLSEKLWYRRFFGSIKPIDETLSAQREYLFGPGTAPPHSYCPYLSHVMSLLMKFSLFPTAKSYAPLFRALALAGLVWERRQDAIAQEIALLNDYISQGRLLAIQEPVESYKGYSGSSQPELEQNNCLFSFFIRQAGTELGDGVNWSLFAILAFLMNQEKSKNEMRSAEKTITKLQNKIDQKKLAKETIKQQLVEARKEIEKTESLGRKLSEKEADCANLLQDIEFSRQKFKEIKEKLLRKKAIKDEIKKKLVASQDRLGVAENTQKKLLKKLSQKQMEKESLKHQLAESKERVKEAGLLIRRFTEKETDFAQLRNDIEFSKQKIDDLRNKLFRNKEIKDEIKSRLTDALHRIHILSNELVSISSEVSALEKEKTIIEME